MLDRASTFADPEIVEFLKTQTVPAAIDQAYQRRQQDAEGDFYRKIVNQSPRKNFGDRTTQGLYMAAADGTFLGFTNNRAPKRVLSMLRNSVAGKPTEIATPLKTTTVDKRWNPKPPERGLVVRVHAQILDGYETAESEHRRIFQQSLSRDNLWITKAERSALIAGQVPQQLIRRIARFHLVDNTRGEPPMWKNSEVRAASLLIDGETLRGKAELETASGDRSYSVDLFGKLEVDGDHVSRFDLVALGTFAGDGPYTRGAPKEPFPLAISFTLADGSDMADSIPPQASRGWLDGYIHP